jgi:uncharacterized protein (DUF427 family)
MARATWRGIVVAESDDVVEVEGNLYFPRSAVLDEHLEDSATTSVCPWKGTASYFTLRVGDDRNVDAAWYYPTPSAAAAQIGGRVAFWRGVEVTR